jgi:hypothetical protein
MGGRAGTQIAAVSSSALLFLHGPNSRPRREIRVWQNFSGIFAGNFPVPEHTHFIAPFSPLHKRRNWWKSPARRPFSRENAKIGSDEKPLRTCNAFIINDIRMSIPERVIIVLVNTNPRKSMFFEPKPRLFVGF